jgi:dihydrofolate synthase/folylpolyglutamate synthase
MDVLGQPQHQFKSIHIAGTNGKGSTAHLLASVFQEAGYKTGLYTSPHLRDFRERIRINGQKIPQNKVIGFVENHHEEFLKIKPSFFEMTVGMAFKYFNDEQVDIAIIETGLGGRLDSTNIINPELSIITNIGMDHTQFLGNTLSSIAQEKAGIIKNNIPVIIGEHQEETDQVFIQMAEEKQASLSFAQDHYQAIWKGEDLLVFKDQELFIEISQFPLKGDYQLKNVCTAVAAADSMNISIGFIIKGFQNVLSNTAFAGRWQTINKKPLTICDTAHNQDGLLLVMEQLQKMEYKQLHFVLGVVDDKQLNQILPLFPKEAIYYFCKADIPRGLPVDKLAEQATLFGLKGNKYQSVSLALQAAQKQANSDDLVFAGGSTFTVAELV